jgi:hypothetical protein
LLTMPSQPSLHAFRAATWISSDAHSPVAQPARRDPLERFVRPQRYCSARQAGWDSMASIRSGRVRGTYRAARQITFSAEDALRRLWRINPTLRRGKRLLFAARFTVC